MNAEHPTPAADDVADNASGGSAARSIAVATETAITAHAAAAQTLIAILKPAIAVADTNADYDVALAAASGDAVFASSATVCPACAGTGTRSDSGGCLQCGGTGIVDHGAARI